MEWEISTKFFGVFNNLQEVINFRSFEFDVIDTIPVNVHNISPLFFLFVCLLIFIILRGKNFYKFLKRFW